MLLTEGIVFEHHVSSQGIKVDPAKIKVIVGLPSPKNSKRGKKLPWSCRILPPFIENFTKITTPMFKLLTKDVEF